jgi:hypothetical protein
MSPWLKKLLTVIIAIILQVIDLFDGDDPYKTVKAIRSKLHVIDSPEDLSV